MVLWTTSSMAASTLVSDFDDGTLQGWVMGDPQGFGFQGTLFNDPSGGNPGGRMVATDTLQGGGGLWALAPSTISGDLSLFEGLQWDEFLPMIMLD